jgi:hypothetical protein
VVGDCTVAVKEAGGESITLLDGSAGAARRARVAASATPMPITGALR